MRAVGSIMVAFAVAFALGACATRPQPTTVTQTAAPATALPSVEAVPNTALPPWIASVSPKGEAADGAQIRVRFTDDLVPIEALESGDRSAVLSHFVVEPAVPGRFIVLTPKMVGFQADALIPHASRIEVRITAGLKDLAGHTLARDVAWSFVTKALTLSLTVPTAENGTPAPVGLTPAIGIEASDPLDVNSLVAHAHLVDAADRSKEILLQLAPTPSPDPSAAPAEPSDSGGPATGETAVHYDLVPIANLATATNYALTIDPGVLSTTGNLPTSGAYHAKLHTFGALAFTGAAMSGEPDKRFADGEPILSFTNDIDQASALKSITLSPPPQNPTLTLLRADQNGLVTLDSDALAPRTTYRVKIAPGVADVFGQTLLHDASASFTTGDLAPSVWAPSGFSIFPSGTNLAIDIATTNLPEGAYRAAFVVLKPSDLIEHDPGFEDEQTSLLPPKSDWPRHPFGQPLNEEVQAALPLHALLGGRSGMLAYGVTARTVPLSQQWKLSEEPQYIGTVGLTNIGVFAQWFPGGGVVRAHHLGDGSPIAGANVELYELPAQPGATNASSNEAPCATGTTDAGGTWTIPAAAFGPCASVAVGDGEAPALMAIVREGRDWAYARTRPYGDGYGYGLDNQGWSAGAPTARGTIVSDRALYQPGEVAKFLGVSYFERNGTIGRGSSTSFGVTAVSPSGAKKSLGNAAPDAFGVFSVPMVIAKNTEVGYWTIEARGSSGEALDGSFRIAEFKPPNFKTDLTLDNDVVTAGATLATHSVSTYLFGAPVEGGTSHVAVTRAPSQFSPSSWDAYTFGRQWLYPEEMPDVPRDVIQSDLPIDAAGNAAQNVTVAGDLPYAMQYTVSATTTDVSNLSVSDSKTFLALPGDAMIGLRSEFLATAGKPFDISTIVLDPHGKPLADRRVALVLQQRIYTSATQIEEGSETPHESVHYDDVATQDIDAKSSPVNARFTAPKPGEYRIRANFVDAASDATSTDTQLWVAGAGEAAWYQGENQALPVKLDKTKYAPGETATALIESPYADADLYFSVIRHDVLLTQHERVHGSAPQVHFTVSAAMLPNAAVQAFLVRRGAPLHDGVPQNLTQLSRLGFAPFDVALDGKYLAIGLSPAHPTLEPAGTQSVTIHITGRDGKPARSEVAIAVVNDAILQLDGYAFPDLVTMVYADEPISTRFGDNRTDVKLQSERRAVEKGFGFGGGVMAGAPSTRVRTKFVPLAYWNPNVRTDAAGNARVSFSLPDDLTTWRVMALGLTTDARFGNGNTTFITTKALVTNPVLPQFARPGDRFSAGVEVTNTGKAQGTLSLSATAAGGAAFAAGDPHAAATSAAAAGATQAYRFDTLVTNPHDATFEFTSKLGSASDAFAFAVPVLTNDILETVVTTGTTQSGVTIPVDVAPSLQGTLGSLRVTMASTLLGDITQPIEALYAPYEGLGTIAASRIAIASDAIVLDRLYGRTTAIPALRKSVVADLAALRVLALADGGFADWPGATKSDVYTTAFDMEQLYRAKVAGFEVEGDLAHGVRYLTAVIANPDELASCNGDAGCFAEARLEALETLGTIGDPRDEFVSDIVAHQANLSYYERVELARFLLRLDDWHGKALSIRDDVFSQVNLSARHATVDVRGAFGESEVAGQSQMLALAIASGMAGDDIDRLLQTLLELRHDGHWGCSCDDAEAMTALTLYAGRDLVPPNFNAVATLPATPPKVQRARFVGFAKTLSAASLPINEVTRGPSSVTLVKNGTGTLHYAVVLSYRAPEASAGIYAGVRIDRIVRAIGSNDPIVSLGLPLAANPPSVAAGRVFDVEDRVIVDHPVENVLVTDPLPAGFEAVDQSFRTASPNDLEGADSLSVDYQSIYKDRVISFVSHLDAGSYAIHYLVRSVTPGTYAWPGATAELQYAPEEFGRTAASTLTVENAK